MASLTPRKHSPDPLQSHGRSSPPLRETNGLQVHGYVFRNAQGSSPKRAPPRYRSSTPE